MFQEVIAVASSDSDGAGQSRSFARTLPIMSPEQLTYETNTWNGREFNQASAPYPYASVMSERAMGSKGGRETQNRLTILLRQVGNELGLAREDDRTTNFSAGITLSTLINNRYRVGTRQRHVNNAVDELAEIDSNALQGFNTRATAITHNPYDEIVRILDDQYHITPDQWNISGMAACLALGESDVAMQFFSRLSVEMQQSILARPMTNGSELGSIFGHAYRVLPEEARRRLVDVLYELPGATDPEQIARYPLFEALDQVQTELAQEKADNWVVKQSEPTDVYTSSAEYFTANIISAQRINDINESIGEHLVDTVFPRVEDEFESNMNLVTDHTYTAAIYRILARLHPASTADYWKRGERTVDGQQDFRTIRVCFDQLVTDIQLENQLTDAQIGVVVSLGEVLEDERFSENIRRVAQRTVRLPETNLDQIFRIYSERYKQPISTSRAFTELDMPITRAELALCHRLDELANPYDQTIREQTQAQDIIQAVSGSRETFIRDETERISRIIAECSTREQLLAEELAAALVYEALPGWKKASIQLANIGDRTKRKDSKAIIAEQETLAERKRITDQLLAEFRDNPTGNRVLAAYLEHIPDDTLRMQYRRAERMIKDAIVKRDFIRGFKAKAMKL